MGAREKLPDTVIAEWSRSHREAFRVSLHEYQGRPVVSVRVWYRDGLGEWRPGKDGLTFGLKHLEPMLDGLVEAYRLACASGALEPEGFTDAAP